MALWEYKVITSGLHGFASLSLLEAHLNALGKDEWEIVHFQTLPNNPLAFNGLVRRSTTRDWTPPEPVVAAPSRHRDIESAEPQRPVAVKPEPTSSVEPAVEEKAAPVREESIRTVRDTERDLDPDAEDDEEDWDNWEDESDELPTFFEAIKPHLRRNQRGPGNSVALDYLAKRWDQRESDILGALKECGFTVPETEEADPDYFEFEGDLYWVNRNNRGQIFLNTREKPRPVFRTAPVTKLSSDDPATAELVAERAAEKAEIEKRNQERLERQAAAQLAAQARAEAQAAKAAAEAAARAERAAAQAANPAPEATAPTGAIVPVPPGEGILDEIRPLMRRNRRGPGHSGSVGFLARALHHSEADLSAALSALGLNPPPNPGDKPTFVEIGQAVYWVNKDSRGGIWINGREKKEGSPKNEAAGDNEPSNAESTQPSPEAPPPPQTTPAPLAEPANSVDSQPPAAEIAAPVEETQPVEGNPASDSSSTEAPFTGDAISSGDPVLAAIRLLLKTNKRGSGVSGEIGFLSRTLEKSEEDLVNSLTAAGLRVPTSEDDKPVFVEQAGDIFWFNKNSTDGSLWVNAKATKSKKPARPRTKKPKSEDKGESPETESPVA